MNSAQDFLFLTVPLSTTTFAFGRLLSKKLTCRIFQSILRPFSTFSYLLASVLGDNVQYISFRAFQQLRFIVPKGKLDLLSIVLCILVLFLALISSSSLYFLVWAFNIKSFEAESNKRIFESFVFLTLTTTGRFFNGFVHAYIDSPLLQSSSLLASNCFLFVTAMYHYFTFKTKRSFCLYLGALLTKVFISVALMVEIRIGIDPAMLSMQ